jgi:hypothetical protein
MSDIVPATVSTPVVEAPPAAPAVPSSPSRPEKGGNKTAVAPLKVLVKTRATPRAFSSQIAAAAPVAAPVAEVAAEPVVAEPATVESAAEVEGAGDLPRPAPEVEPLAADSTAAKTAAVAAPATEPDAPTVDASELTKRLAKLNRREARLQQEIGIAAELKSLVGPQHATRETVRLLVQRHQMIENGRAAAMQDPAGFLEQAFGVPRAHTNEKTLTGVIGDTALTPQEREQRRLDGEILERKQRLDAYEKQLQEAAQKQQVQVTEQQARTYIAGTIAPILADVETYKFTRAELGADAGQQIWNTMVAKYNATGKTPDAKTVADHFEKVYRDRAAKAAALLGASVTPKKPASPSRTEPLPAQRPAPQTRNVPQPNPAIHRSTRKPYTIKQMS